MKIPRDAARPKLEDLQSWQDEIPTLPFQPDEEAILEKIINNAQEFRNHVAPFCNPVMATADEAETQRFYLRKIEGAEILLAYETNFFRQELHKWSPVAPEPPPVLENSKSTRKPRPTKLQKLMAQHGVDDPEALPQNLRTKPHTFKRKSSEPTAGRPQPLQPAPGRSDSGTPTSHAFPVPSSVAHHGMPVPVLSGLHDGSGHAHPSHYGGFAGVQDVPFSMAPRDSASGAFVPHSFLHGGGLPSPTFQGASPRQSGIFNERGFSSIDSVALGGVASPLRDSFGAIASSQSLGAGIGGTPGGSQVDQMFNDLTNQTDEDDLQKKNGTQEREEVHETYSSKWDDDDSNMDMFQATY